MSKSSHDSQTLLLVVGFPSPSLFTSSAEGVTPSDSTLSPSSSQEFTLPVLPSTTTTTTNTITTTRTTSSTFRTSSQIPNSTAATALQSSSTSSDLSSSAATAAPDMMVPNQHAHRTLELVELRTPSPRDSPQEADGSISRSPLPGTKHHQQLDSESSAGQLLSKSHNIKRHQRATATRSSPNNNYFDNDDLHGPNGPAVGVAASDVNAVPLMSIRAVVSAHFPSNSVTSIGTGGTAAAAPAHHQEPFHHDPTALAAAGGAATSHNPAERKLLKRHGNKYRGMGHRVRSAASPSPMVSIGLGSASALGSIVAAAATAAVPISGTDGPIELQSIESRSRYIRGSKIAGQHEDPALLPLTSIKRRGTQDTMATFPDGHSATCHAALIQVVYPVVTRSNTTNPTVRLSAISPQSQHSSSGQPSPVAAGSAYECGTARAAAPPAATNSLMRRPSTTHLTMTVVAADFASHVGTHVRSPGTRSTKTDSSSATPRSGIAVAAPATTTVSTEVPIDAVLSSSTAVPPISSSSVSSDDESDDNEPAEEPQERLRVDLETPTASPCNHTPLGVLSPPTFTVPPPHPVSGSTDGALEPTMEPLPGSSGDGDGMDEEDDDFDEDDFWPDEDDEEEDIWSRCPFD